MEHADEIDEAHEFTPPIRFVELGDVANARWTGTAIEVHKDLEQLDPATRRALLEPLIAHELVHARAGSSPPTDEAELKRYVGEEAAAYRAQFESRMEHKQEFESANPPHKLQELPEGARNVLAGHLALEQILLEGSAAIPKWELLNQHLETLYRRRMDNQVK